MWPSANTRLQKVDFQQSERADGILGLLQGGRTQKSPPQCLFRQIHFSLGRKSLVQLRA